MDFLWGFIAIIVLLGIAVLFSSNRKAIRVRTVVGAFALQFLFAVLVLYTTWGQATLEFVTGVVSQAIGTSSAGIDFLFGGVYQAEGIVSVFAFEVLPVIIFFSALISILYHFGIMQLVVRFLGGGISKVLKTSKVESIGASANIFVGMTEAPLAIKPYIKNMTASEMFAIMVGGMSTVAGSVMVGIAAMGIPLDYLIAASFMSAPAGLLMAKIMMPETELSETRNEISLERDKSAANFIDAASKGTTDGLKLAANVGAMLIAFISLIALVNLFLGFLGGLMGVGDLSLEMMLGYVFAPLAFLVGVPWQEAVMAGSFIGQKTIVNEFVGFAALSEAIDLGNVSPRTEVIASFALCGFANLSSIAILLGGLGGLAPERRPFIAKYGPKALLAATLVNLMNAAIAGMLVG
ncbi:NupC/NupG family nucleoside CNT transporter [Shouchella shacheensis]|uniref:NupC/NupG family nucleoside CNT transporter n=1 Tax=Shouchella shacheensis TaxID=1649580 RepID=UPI00073FB23B|nr:NupC/NupG family nucleoside CNT transporter [Shouchella shacheensis]